MRKRLLFKNFVLSLIKVANNKLLKKLGVKIVSSNHPSRDFDEFFVHLKKLGFKPDYVIDVGVAFGTDDFYKAFSGSKFLLVEPNPNCSQSLNRIEKQLKHCEIYKVAAGDRDGKLMFNVHSDVSGSSVLKQLEGEEELDGLSIEVPVNRIDTIANYCEGTILLKLDTQGYEIKALDGSINILEKVEMIIVECSFFKFMQDAPEIGDIFKWMHEHNYKCYEFLEGHYRLLDNALAQVDLVFIKDNSPLRNNHCFSLCSS